MLVVLECVRPAPRSSQCPDHQPVSVLAQVAEGDRFVGDHKCSIGVSRLQLQVAEPDHGVESQPFEPLLLPVAPV